MVIFLNRLARAIALGLASLTLIAGVLLQTALPAAALPPGNAITDGQALLRYALPLDNAEIRDVQKQLEAIADGLRAKRWSAIHGNLQQVAKILNLRSDKILAAVPEASRTQAEGLLNQMKQVLPEADAAVEAKDKTALQTVRSTLLSQVGQIESLMVGRFPFEIPAEYRNLPQLLGRATILMKTSKGDLTLVVDGYNAPLTAGNFVDLVQRGFYNNLPFTRAEDFYVLQAGDPPGPEDGFIDPKTKQERTIPLEIRVEGDEAPVYGSTLEDLGLYKAQPILPFSAYGTLGMARPNDNVNGGSSQFFFFLFEPELTPAGLNLIDGRYAAFGYLTEGKEVLEKLTPEDKILSAKVIDGANHLVQPS
jgi:peptidylprolyl isomerase